MMESLSTAKTLDVKTLEVKARVRHWDDAEINGDSSADGKLVPFKNGDFWTPKIDVKKGVVIGWPQGTEAVIGFKVVDEGSYYLKDSAGEVVMSIVDGYVPKMMSPAENGYGDYIYMDIDTKGKIAKWKPDLTGFGVNKSDSAFYLK